MPPKTKKQKSDPDATKKSATTSKDDVWYDIPILVKNKLISQINRCFVESSDKTGYVSRDKYVGLAYALQEKLDDIIYPSPSTPCMILERMEVTNLLYDAEREVNDAGQEKEQKDNPRTESVLTVKQKENITRYVADMTRLVQKAIKVYHMLDTANKGSISRDDIYRAIRELDSTTSEAPDSNYDYIVSMMTDFTIPRGQTEPQLMLSVNCDDIVRIAKLVNL